MLLAFESRALGDSEGGRAASRSAGRCDGNRKDKGKGDGGVSVGEKQKRDQGKKGNVRRNKERSMDETKRLLGNL